MRRRDKVAGSRRSEGPTRDAWISTCPDARRNIYVGQVSPTRRLAQFDIAAVKDMVPTSRQAKLVSKLMRERRVILLVGVVDCINGVDRGIQLVSECVCLLTLLAKFELNFDQAEGSVLHRPTTDDSCFVLSLRIDRWVLFFAAKASMWASDAQRWESSCRT